MQKITLLLASSKELKRERELFEIEIYRKCKAWFEQGIFLHLDIWEDLSAAMRADGSQSGYNEKVKAADIFVLLVWNKLGIYSAEEFETAFGQFSATSKPFIFTYFKEPPDEADESLHAFQRKLQSLGHFYASFEYFPGLWMQFDKELERLYATRFARLERPETAAGNSATITGNDNIVVQGVSGSTVQIKR
jgi:hypothetical protein